jgi:integrase
MTPLLGKNRLTSLSASQIRIMEHSLLNEKGLASRTVRHCHAVLHNALNEAVRQDLLDRNPTSDVTAPRIVRKELCTLSRDQVKQLLSVSEGGRWHALWGLLVTTGMRLGEACALRWNDVDFVRGVATVQRSVQRQRGKGLLFVEPKTAGSRRAIRLPQGTMDMLKAHWDVVEHIRGSAGEPWREHSLIFPALTGGPLDPSRVNTALHNDLHRAGLPRLRVHDLRHTAATLLLEEGTHPKVVQDLLGHSTIAMTLDLYSHVTPRLQEEATARMQELLFDARSTTKSRRQQNRKR